MHRPLDAITINFYIYIFLSLLLWLLFFLFFLWHLLLLASTVASARSLALMPHPLCCLIVLLHAFGCVGSSDIFFLSVSFTLHIILLVAVLHLYSFYVRFWMNGERMKCYSCSGELQQRKEKVHRTNSERNRIKKRNKLDIAIDTMCECAVRTMWITR